MLPIVMPSTPLSTIQRLSGKVAASLRNRGLTQPRESAYYPRLAPAIAATGSVRFTANPTNTQTITLNGTAITFVTSGATGNQVNIGADAGATGGALLALLRASTDANIMAAAYSGFEGGTTSLSDSEYNLTVTHLTPGAAGNAYTLATTTSATLSGATLAGGSDSRTLTLSSSETVNPLSAGRALSCTTNEFVTWLGMRDYVISGSTIPYKTVSYAGSGRGCPFWKMAFIHVGTRLVIYMTNNGGAGAKWYIKVDDQYVTPTLLNETYSGAWFYYDLPFEGVRARRIEMGGYGLGGCYPTTLYIGANDEVYPAPIRGPRCAILGTSFAEGTPHSDYAAGAYPVHFSDAMGWDDVYNLGSSATGLLADNSGSGKKYRDRVTDIPADTDVVLVEVGLNQGGYTAAQLGTETPLLIDAIRVQAPNADVFFFDTWKGGVETIDTTARDQLAAIKAACVPKGVTFLSLTELPLRDGLTPATTTLASAAAAAATTISTVGALGANTTHRFDDGTKFVVRSRSGSGPYTVTLGGPLASAQSSGANTTQCGRSVLSGNGRVGSTIGWGTSDIMVGSDGNPSDGDGVQSVGLWPRLAGAGGLRGVKTNADARRKRANSRGLVALSPVPH